MNVTETLRLVKTLRAIQPAQVFTDDTPEVWQALLRNVALTDALAAVEELAGQEAFIGTDDILRQVRKLRHDRLGKVPAALLLPPAGLTDSEERAWARTQRHLALSGASSEQLAARQHRPALTGRPDLPRAIEAAVPGRRQQPTPPNGRHEITQAEIDAAQAQIATLLGGTA